MASRAEDVGLAKGFSAALMQQFGGICGQSEELEQQREGRRAWVKRTRHGIARVVSGAIIHRFGLVPQVPDYGTVWSIAPSY